MTLKKFSHSLFHVCPLLSHWGNDHEQTFQSFLAYKTRVPVCGAIMLNDKWDKVSTELARYSTDPSSASIIVPARQRLESHICVEFPQGQNQ